MATATQGLDNQTIPVIRTFPWSGIFAGTLLFLAIETTFGVLAMAIFPSAAAALSTNTVGTSMSVGAGIWMIVLSIIALYFAGMIASTYTGAPTPRSGLYVGLITFGMCIFTSFLIAGLALGTVGFRTSVSREGSAGDYWLFVALILSMIAAALGGIHGSTAGGLKASLDRISDTKRVA